MRLHQQGDPPEGQARALLPCENGGVRHLTDDEIRWCQGVEDSVYKGLQKARTQDEVMASIVMGPGRQAAGAIIGLLEADESEDDKAGNCLDR